MRIESAIAPLPRDNVRGRKDVEKIRTGTVQVALMSAVRSQKTKNEIQVVLIRGGISTKIDELSIPD